jgi:enoyl-CoA hydratase
MSHEELTGGRGLVRRRVAEAVAEITLARPEKRNAQNMALLYELNAAFDQAARDDAVKVIVLDADGPHFSAGHDLSDLEPSPPEDSVLPEAGFGRPGAEGWFATEKEAYLGLCDRWRNIPKPTIAAVQGKSIAGGLMLIWVCDLVIAASDATFADPVLALGANGCEYFAHPWELGPRKAKEALFTGDPWTAQEAHARGMVNRVVAPEQLREEALTLAKAISQRSSFSLRLAKESVNMAMDRQGLSDSIRAAFGLHHLAHAHNQLRFGSIVDPAGIQLKRP